MTATHALDDDALILCVGARRSGTNWLQRVIASHPAVADIPTETYLFSHGIAPLLERFQHASPASTTVGKAYAERGDLLLAVRRFCDDVLSPYLAAASGAGRLLERTPEHVRSIALIAELYPEARFVHVIRDGFAVTRSLLGQSWGPSAAEDAAREWRDFVQDGRRQGAGVRHYTEVRYEQLVDDTAATVHQLFADLDLPVDDAVLDGALRESAVVGNTGGRPRASGDLPRRDHRAVRKVAGALLAELGYDRRRPAAAAPAASGPTTPTDAPAAPDGPHWASRSIQDAQHAVDLAVECLRGLRPAEELSALVAPAASLRLAGEGEESTWRGADHLTAFLEAVRADPALGWPQEQSDIHPSPGLFTVLSSFRAPDGEAHDRAFVIRIGQAGMTELAVYRFPRTTTAGAASDER